MAGNDEYYESARQAMVSQHIEARDIDDPAVLEAMRIVPREAFMAEEEAHLAYMDSPAGIGEGQTISQPYVVAKMAQMADLSPKDRVLEIGTGSGYGAAVLGEIAAEVYTIERFERLAERAADVLDKLNYDNIHVAQGDGTEGWPSAAPFDAIVVTAGAPGIPLALKAQLAVGGRLVIPAGRTLDDQELLLVRRISKDDYQTERHGSVAFVPLVGAQGWQHSD